jgi:hypothetical protein
MSATVNYLSQPDLAKILSFGRFTSSKHLYARKLRAASRLKKRRGIILNQPKKLKRGN